MRRGLGKGLSQLLGEDEAASLSTISIDAIRPNPRQPRKSFSDEAIADLAASIKEFGIIQPLVVRSVGGGQYELIAGERRLRASQKAGLKEVPAIVRQESAQGSLEIALIENVQREDISPMECAWAYKQLAEEFGLSQNEIADKVGKSRAAVANALRLLQLSDTIQAAVHEGRVTEGHARALLMADTRRQQEQIFERILEQGISVRETERLARGQAATPRAAGSTKKRTPSSSDPNDQALQRALEEFLGSPVQLTREGPGGKMVVEFYNDEDFQRILDVLGFRY